MKMVPFDQALAAVISIATPLGIETIPFTEAFGRVLANDLCARSDSPAFDVSAMDGYGVNDSDLKAAPIALEVIMESYAGGAPTVPLNSAGCVRIFTGAPVPPGVDRVVIQENVVREGKRAHFAAFPTGGRNIRRAGSDFRSGDRLISKGTKLHWRAMTTAAAADYSGLAVYKKPKVIILATGDELAAPGTAYKNPGHIPESVSFGIAEYVKQKGGKVVRKERLIDDPHLLSTSADNALKDADLIIVTGGASVGDKDHARSMFGIRSSDYVFPKVAIKPGKPVWMARRGEKTILGLPGNPGSALVTARLFLGPLLAGLTGQNPVEACHFRDLPCRDSLPEVGGRETFSRGYIEEGKAVLFSSQDSSVQSSLVDASILVRRPAFSKMQAAGSLVSILDF